MSQVQQLQKDTGCTGVGQQNENKVCNHHRGYDLYKTLATELEHSLPSQLCILYHNQPVMTTKWQVNLSSNRQQF